MPQVKYTNVPQAQVVELNTALSAVFNASEVAAILKAVNTVLGNTASTTNKGTVLKAAARADNASTIPSAAPAGGTGAAAGAWDTSGNRDAAIATINGLRTAVSQLQSEYNDLLAKLRTAGVLS